MGASIRDSIQWTVGATITHNGDSQCKKSSPTKSLKAQVNGDSDSLSGDDVDNDSSSSTSKQLPVLNNYFCTTFKATGPPDGKKFNEKSPFYVKENMETILVEMWYRPHQEYDSNFINNVAGRVKKHVFDTVKKYNPLSTYQ